MFVSVRKLAIAAALATAGLTATPAMATIEMVDASSIQGANVLFNAGVQTGTTVTGSTQGGTLVNFQGTTTQSDVIRANGGQARVEGDLDTITANPNDTFGLTALTFQLATGSFTNLEFNLFGTEGGGTAYFTAIDNEGQTFNFDNGGLGFVLSSGSNFFGFHGIDGQSIVSFAISIMPGSIQDVRQIRLDEVGAVGAVPEPGTWLMMLLGFGAIGFGMRRRRSGQSGALLQIA